MTVRMHLALDLCMTHLDGRRRSPGSWVNSVYPDPAVFEDIARIAERGCIDMLFFGDGTGIPSTWKGSEDDAVRWGIGWRSDCPTMLDELSLARLLPGTRRHGARRDGRVEAAQAARPSIH
ncbi:hypothetical protein [Neoroseomonas rubea]|uniref:hypothetical protein n=1 Tax=Neoroseomonas rubea TaxID=2748666 RepID=UPI0018DFE148|nr:hypothetical protein [Roseomonas rubea]